MRRIELNLFSERKGLKKLRTEVQIDSIDNALRNRLWNVLDFYLWKRGREHADYSYGHMSEEMKSFFIRLWHYYFRKPVDTLSSKWADNYDKIRKYYFGCPWNEVYDFVEFTAKNYPDKPVKPKFMKTCDGVLESELSAYRFVGGKIIQVTSEEEISEIEEALATPLKPVRAHLEKSLELLSDRKSPDYRNSIKESISAVEAICRLITKNDKATLGQALKEVETKVALHGALKKGFSNLYGYTSSAEGIRHALLEETTLSFEDAKFMLVSCSAFINYLIAKTSKAGIKIGK